MSKFYKEISKYYDYIFPVKDVKFNLIKEVSGDYPKDILDVACGSGGYSKKLRDEGYNITAIDLDENMINKLKEKDSEIDAQVLNMLEIEKLNKKFDTIFCIGNSLVHLNNDEEIGEFLKSCNNSLKTEGRMLIQIVNYDRVLAKNIKYLPTIKNKEVNLVFERYYDYLKDKHKIDFSTILKVEDRKFENNVYLHPIKSKGMRSLIEKAGFSSIKFYGNFDKGEYEPMKSFPLVIVAEK
ncbi:class I SAM-dependent methyltransferase [Clostridium sp. D2Q-14]|uniref:class I SAM-dependent methyltransferase n=1 Tax=Anaeromonas gelatinilytica TaxID=2683194 RepID=UPI00193C241B|nr:class I SAM-dependent methyltransferase [Anaeromonas gelatinilytica]MBS4534166.1 class I SAM-dependent methyltransferase [Anaeromonas gelatinilytica]